MPASQKVCKAWLLLALALCPLGWTIACSGADTPIKPGNDPDTSPVPAAAASSAGQEFDPAVIRAGEAAFQRSCTNCHDAARALDRTKDLAGWRTTVRKMARKKDADIPDRDLEPIAVYLASRNPAAAAPSAEKPKTEKPKTGEAATSAAAAGQKFDPAVVSAGQAAFERSCTTCHEASRALERTKDLAGWRATVQRMAGKRGANVSSSDIEPIAVFLASRSAAAAAPSADKEKTGESAAAKSNLPPAFSAFATLSPLWRGGNDNLQNPGFAPLAWAGASWQGQVVSARLTACTACHGVQEAAFLSRIDLVEAAVRVDLSKYVEPCWHGAKASIDAGRLIIPFGAFSAQANPGTYRTVSTPLIFNMGQRIYNQDLGVPVLPQPYSNTAVDLNVELPLITCETHPVTASIDAYLNNGLWGSSSGIDWLQSRNLLDNNDRPGYGGRVTVGDPYIRAGASIMGGRFDDPRDPSVTNGPLDYLIYGVDLQAHYKKLFRFQVEYARRDSDRIGVFDSTSERFTEHVDGYYAELEVRPWEKCCTSFLVRHDYLRVNSALPPPGSTLPTGVFNVERVTFGINIELWQQSLLMLDYERWFIPERPSEANVFGIRYTVTF